MMILHIDSSIQGEQSVSRKLTAAAVASLRRQQPDATVIYRDVVAHPVPALTLPAMLSMPAAHGAGPAEAADRALGEEVLTEFLAADTIIIGAPMYNFSIPAQLRAWIDRIIVAGRTFAYGEKGVEGLAAGKKVIVAISSGGVYAPATAMAAFDQNEPFLRTILGFIGIRDITFIRAGGIAMGPEARAQAEATALAEIEILKVA